MNRPPVYFVVSGLAGCASYHAYGHVVEAVVATDQQLAVLTARPLIETTFDATWEVSLTATPLTDGFLAFAFERSRPFICSVTVSDGHSQLAHLPYAAHARYACWAAVTGTETTLECWPHCMYNSVAMMAVDPRAAMERQCSAIVWYRRPAEPDLPTHFYPPRPAPHAVSGRPLSRFRLPWRAYPKEACI